MPSARGFKLSLFLCLLAWNVHAQVQNPQIIPVTTAPSGACGGFPPLQYVIDENPPQLWGCNSVTSMWVLLNSGATAGVTSISGTANQITASAAVGGVTLSITTNPTLPGTTTGTFSGNLTGNVTGNASGTAATITGQLALANLTVLTTSQDLLYRTAGSALGRVPIPNANECLGNTAGVWASIACGSGSGGTVTSVGWTGGIVSIATATTTPAFTIAGTSGGVPYFSGASTWASSGALTANLPVIGGGAGAAPAVGTRSGNTTAFVTTTGAQTSGDCVKIDASGNHVANGSACGSGSSAFSALTGSTNTTAAMVVGSGASLAATGTGTIAATNNGFGVSYTGGNLAVDTATIPSHAILQADTDFLCADASGSATAQTCAPATGTWASYTNLAGIPDGAILHYVPGTTNGAGVQVNVATLGAANIKQADGTTNATAGQLVAGYKYNLTWQASGTVWKLAPEQGVGTCDSSHSISGVGSCITGGGGSGTVTSVGWTGGIVSIATATTTPAFTIAGTSGGIPYFASGSTWASSAALAANALVIGGGAGAAPATTTTGTGILTFLGTPSSANLAAAVTNETGSGALVFANTPALVTPDIGAATGTSLALTGSLSSGTSSSVAGTLELTQGTAPSAGTTSVKIYAPASVTSYIMNLPAAAATGFYLGTNSSGVVTMTQVASSGSGNVCLSTSCSMTTPILGTPTSGVMTNVTGTATGLTSGITNALKSASTTVDVAAATAPSTGQVLTATDSTHATWQTPGSGSGTVTTTGTMTVDAIVTSNATTVIKTPSATATLDSSGNIATPGSISLGVGGSVGGYSAYGQGTATTAPTSSVGFMAPTSVTTKFMMTLPAAPATGFLLNTGTSDPSTVSFVAGNGTGNVCLTTSCTMVTPVLGAATGTSLSVTGSLTAGSSSSVAGTLELTQGTAPSAGTTSIKLYAPASVTSYIRNLPAAAATGFYLGTNSAGTVTDTQVASTGTGSVVLGTSPAITTDLHCASAGGCTLGTNALPASSAYIGGAATNNIQLTGTATTAKVATFPDFTGTVAVAATSTTATQALFATATAGAPAYRAVAYTDLPAVAFPTPATSVTLAAPGGIFECTGTCTVTLPVPAAGYQFCVRNANNVATVITFAAIGSSARYEATAKTSYGTAGTGTLVSGGAVTDQMCLVGKDSTHYDIYSYTGTWTAN